MLTDEPSRSMRWNSKAAGSERTQRNVTAERNVWRLSFWVIWWSQVNPEGLRKNASVRLGGLEVFCSAGLRRVTFNAQPQAPLASTAALATGTAKRAPAVIGFAVAFDWQIGQSAPVLRTTSSEVTELASSPKSA